MHCSANRNATATTESPSTAAAANPWPFPSSWLIPLSFALGASWLASLNGYGFHLPLVIPAVAIGGAVIFLRKRLTNSARKQVLDPALIAFAMSAVAMLVGIELDLGPRGLAVLASWCVTTPLTTTDLLYAKLTLLPAAHGFMVLACLLHMLLARDDVGGHVVPEGSGRFWWRRCQRCALVILSLPFVLMAADVLVLGVAEQSDLSGATSEWLSAAMVLTMATLMAVCAVAIQRLMPLSVRR